MNLQVGLPPQLGVAGLTVGRELALQRQTKGIIHKAEVVGAFDLAAHRLQVQTAIRERSHLQIDGGFNANAHKLQRPQAQPIDPIAQHLNAARVGNRLHQTLGLPQVVLNRNGLVGHPQA